MACWCCNSVVRPGADVVKASETGDGMTGREGCDETRRVMLQLGGKVTASCPIPNFHSLQQHLHRQSERRARLTGINGELCSVIASRRE